MKMIKHIKNWIVLNIKYIKTWAIYTVISLLGGFVAGAVQAFILGLILSLVKVPLDIISGTTAFTGFIAGLIVSFFVFKWGVKKFILPQTIERQESKQEANPGA